MDGRILSVEVGSDTEFFGAYEVFATSDYDIESGRAVTRVLDLGANVGFAALLFAERYPTAEIVCVEPAPDTFARLAGNVVALDRVRAVNVAVGADGPVLFDLSSPSVERAIGDRGTSVRGLSLTSLLHELDWPSVDLMKIDVEGAEFAVFMDPALAKVQAMVGEVHVDVAPSGYLDVQTLLPDFEVDVNPAIGSSAVMFRAVRSSVDSRPAA